MLRSDHVLLLTDGVWELLADENGRAEARLSEGGAALLDTILADVNRELAGRPQPDDLTLLTASVVWPEGDH
jgi:hypothetical protein